MWVVFIGRTKGEVCMKWLYVVCWKLEELQKGRNVHAWGIELESKACHLAIQSF